MHLPTRHGITFFLLAVVLAHPAAAEMPTYSVRATETPVVVDGVLEEPSWEDATVIPVNIEYQPGENIPAIVSTDAMITFDHDYLYVAFRAEDSEPSKIRAHLMDRDEINTFVQDDHVLVMIDTFNDERRAFQFRVNPLGVQADAIFSETDGIEDFSWDLIWDSAGKITDFGYVVEIAISMKQLRYQRTHDAQTWGIELSRSYPRNVRHRFSAVPKDRNSSCNLCQVAKVTGFTELARGRNVEINPTLTAIRTDVREQPDSGELTQGEADYEFGVTGSWGVTPNITLTGTINPDFSQVEADVAQLEVNERFALFYPERRPFFLVGIDLFSSPIQAVFTRTVVDPSWGLKVTGKEGRHGLGFFVTSDDVNQLLIPSNQGTAYAMLEGTAQSTVLRYRLDVGAGSTAGTLITTREGVDYHNRVAGIDGFFRLSPSNTFRFQALKSDTKYPSTTAELYGQPLDPFSGYAVEARFQHASRNWFAQVEYEDFDPGFRADVGFVPRVDTRTATAIGQRTIWGEADDWYTDINIGAFVSRTHDHSGELTDEFFQLYGNVGGPWQSRIGVNLSRIGEFYGGVYYDGLDQIGANLDMQPTGSVRFTINGLVGDAIDYANNQPGDLVEVNPSIELKLGRRVNAQLFHNMRQLDVTGGRLFRADLTQLRLVYHFNVRTLIRGILQYYNIKSDPSLYTGPYRPEIREETLYSEFLFSYKLNPQTVVFVGTSENRLGLPGLSLTAMDRTYFIKLGYAWLL
jgi:hypothetical protein